MSDELATSPRLSGEAETVEERLADLMATAVVRVDGYRLSDEDRARVVAALRRGVSDSFSPQQHDCSCAYAIGYPSTHCDRCGGVIPLPNQT